MTRKTLTNVISILTLAFILSGCAKLQEAPTTNPEEHAETSTETILETPVDIMVEEDLDETEKETAEEKEEVKVEETPASPEKETFIIKNMAGKSFTDAKSVLSIFKLKITEEYSDSVDKGLVISQNPNSGEKEKGIEIEVRVSIGKKPVAVVPNPEPIVEVVESTGPDETDTKSPAFEPYEEKLPNVPALTIKYAYAFDSSLESEILRLLNAYRKENGLNELQMDDTLRKISRWKSNSQIQNNYFGHNDVNHGHTPDIIDYRMDGISERYTALGENLHFTTRSSVAASSIVEAWKKSPGHNQNMLEPWWTHVGIGVAKSSSSGSQFHNQGAILSTQVFGSK